MNENQPLLSAEEIIARVEGSDTHTTATHCDDRPTFSTLVLRRRDQAVVATCAAIALGCLAAWWIAGRTRGLSEIELDVTSKRAVNFTVDINAAEWPEIAQLPVVGETLARRIVESRERDGPFHSRVDLRRVRGIGVVTLERIEPHLKPLH